MKYKCLNCNYIYDEEKEILSFAGLNEEWICPECGASKSEFELIEEDDFERGKDIFEEVEEDEEDDEEDEFEEEDY
jgi:rubredoxin